jgi:hypothetical protein
MRVRSHLRFRVKSALQPKGHGPVVRQRNPHMGAENADFDPRVPGTSLLYQDVEQSPTLLRCRCRREAGSQAFMGLRRQGELRHQQEIAPGLVQAQIHLSRLVPEHAVLKQALEQAHGAGFIVRGPDSHQHQKSSADDRDPLAVDVDGGLYYALQQSNHG